MRTKRKQVAPGWTLAKVAWQGNLNSLEYMCKCRIWIKDFRKQNRPNGNKVAGPMAKRQTIKSIS